MSREGDDDVMESRNLGLPRDSTGRQPYRITIAAGDDEVRQTLAQLLILDGFEATQVADGELLLKKLKRKEGTPDMLILEHQMPGRAGLDILRVLRERGWETPVIMITSLGKEVFPAARALGACAVFEKPLDYDGLRNAVYFYLTERCSKAALQAGSSEKGDLELVFSDTWEAFEVWIRQTIGGDFNWFTTPRDTPEGRQIVIDSIRAAIASNDGRFPPRNAFLERSAG